MKSNEKLRTEMNPISFINQSLRKIFQNYFNILSAKEKFLTYVKLLFFKARKREEIKGKLDPT